MDMLKEKISKNHIEILQINLGNRCNQSCYHCHIGASPSGEKNMDSETSGKIVEKLLSSDVCNVEFTGGTPELNPNLTMFIEKLSDHKKISVRTNLTVLDRPEFSFFAELYKEHQVKVIASFPSLSPDSTDKQRGENVFCTSIQVLKKLNALGYGTEGLPLDLVYNPHGDCLPPEQGMLEQEYKQVLKDRHGISFDNLITIVNSPINRFSDYLESQNRLDEYRELLENSFNPETLNNLMCRHLVSVDYQGHVYDCDFNLALGMKIKCHESKKFWEIDFSSFSPEIFIGKHCYACTANKGSSCHGVLIKAKCGLNAGGNQIKCMTVQRSSCS